MIISQSGFLRALSFGSIAAAVLSVWFGIVVAVTAIAEPTDSVLVLGLTSAVASNAAVTSQVQMLDGSGRTLAVRGTEPGFVRRLYAGGAWLVLPARLGCRSVSAGSDTERRSLPR